MLDFVPGNAVAKLFLSALLLFFSIACATISTEAPERGQKSSRFIEGFESSSTSFERLAEIQDRAKPIENSFSLNFGPSTHLSLACGVI
ncbi:MAG: hypothetical protein K0Q83_2620 [Deltaproteobacteria bacterium]|nr:hypothetical protein [Deltaproteobacteria bacterium]